MTTVTVCTFLSNVKALKQEIKERDVGVRCDAVKTLRVNVVFLNE